MEHLLALAFDNLSSYDGPKIRKGLRQVEGLLAQICLSSPSPSSRPSSSSSPSKQHKRSKSAASIDPYQDRDGENQDETGEIHDDKEENSQSSLAHRKSLSDLSVDPAFREFFKLQEGFEWNVALRLINTLDRLMAKSPDGQNDLLILSALDTLQGALLLHPPSKMLFSRDQHMNLLLDLLEPVNCPAIQSATLLVLVAALIDNPPNTRAFESLDGLLTVTSLFKSRSTSREVKLKLVEFLYFYLMPEVPSIPRADARGSVPAMLQRSPSKLAGAFRGASDAPDAAAAAAAARAKARGRSGSESDNTLTTEEKQALLGRHLSSVEDLVRDLRISTPFGGVL